MQANKPQYLRKKTRLPSCFPRISPLILLIPFIPTPIPRDHLILNLILRISIPIPCIPIITTLTPCISFIPTTDSLHSRISTLIICISSLIPGIPLISTLIPRTLTPIPFISIIPFFDSLFRICR